MKVSPRQADSFVRKPSPETRAILVYGPDTGLVHERIDSLARLVVDDLADVFRFTEISADQLKNEPPRLIDEALALSLGGGRRVILVTGGGDSLTATLSAVLEHPGMTDPEAGLVLVRGGDLGGRSSLRKLFESAANAAAIACYADDSQALHRLVGDTLRDSGISAEPRVVDFIVGNLGSDRQLNRRELEKLTLYAGRGGSIGIDAAAACIGDSSAAALDDTILAAADGDYGELEHALERAWSEGLSPVAILRAAQRHLQRLHIVSAQTNRNNRSLDEAMKSLRPPVFWKTAARFRNQAGRWQPRPIEQALTRLTETEILVKSTGIPDRAACARALLAVAQIGRTGLRQ